METVECWKCKGSGYIARYKHIDNGICFACNGTGRLTNQDRVRLADEMAKKGIKSGKLSQLLKVEHVFLNEVTPEEYKRALISAVNKLGGKQYSDSYNVGILKNKITKELGRDKSGMLPSDPKAGKTYKGMIYAEGVKQHPSEEAEIYEDSNGLYYNRYGHEIKSPFSLSRKDIRNAEVNSAKPLGSPKLDAAFEAVEEYAHLMRNVNGEWIGDRVQEAYDHVLAKAEKNIPGLIANVSFSKFEVTGKPGVLGIYRVQHQSSNDKQIYSLEMNPVNIMNIAKSIGDNPPTPEQRELLRKNTEQLYNTLVHELSHAYHQQALAKRDISLWGENGGTSGETPIHNLIANDFEDAVDDVEKLTGMNGEELRKFYFDYTGIEDDEIATIKKILTVFPHPYGTVDEKEFFATISEALSTKEKMNRLREKFPERYELLKKAYRGVVDIEALFKDSN